MFNQVCAQKVGVDTVVYSSVDVEMLGIEDGLSQGMINAVVEDKVGYLWIATKEGLNRYDGSGIKVFRHNPNDSLSLSGNLVTCLLVDEKNRLWVGTQSNGVNLYDRRTESFIHFGQDQQNSKSIPSDYIAKLFLTPEGAVGVLSRDVEDVCLIFSEEEKGNNTRFSVRNLCEHYPVLAENGHCKNGNPNTLDDNNRNDSRFSKDGSFWFYTGTDSIHWYSAQALQGIGNAVAFPTVDNPLFNIFHNTSALVFNQDRSRVYLTDGVRSLKKFNSHLGLFEPYVELSSERSFKGQIFVVEDEFIWADLGGNQMLKIDPKAGVYKLLNLTGPTDELTISAAITRDSFGNFWLPTNGSGVGKISSRHELFHQLSNGASRIKNFWVLRQERPGGKALFDLETARQFMDPHGRFYPVLSSLEKGFMPAHLPFNENGDFLMNKGDDQQQCIISGNFTDGLMSDIFCKTNSDEESHGLAPIFFDRNRGLWFCNSFNNQKIILNHIPPGENAPKQYRFPINPGPLHYRFVSDWYEDINETWWFATVKGLFSFDRENETWQHYQNIEGDLSSLSFDMTLSICPDPREPERFLWIGTEGRGLNKFDREKETFVHYITDNGLPNDVIYGIQSDEYNNLWLSTNRGLCLFDPETENVRNFTEADGLNGNEFNRYEYSKSADGTMYFGGVEGTTWFLPEDFYRDSTTSNVIINGLKVVNKPIVYEHNSVSGDAQYALSAPMEYTKHLEFNHDVGMISLNFTMLDFTVPEQHQFRYQLEGLDKEWIEARNAREATYTNLSPGDYTFRVMGLNSNHVWSEPSELLITILPPWWATWWFRTLIVLAVAGLLYALYRYRLAQVVRVERMRNRIAQDLHDEIGSTLSSISLYSAVIQKSANGMPEKSKAVLDKISNSTSEMMESMNDIVWTIKADNDHFEHVVNRMRAFAVNMTEARGIALKFEVKGNVEKLHLDMVARKNLYLIFKEAVNNSVKYAHADTLSVEVSYQNDQLEMVISDNGCGFEMETVGIQNNLMGGNGLRGMKSRAAEINAQFKIESQSDGGTRIIVRTTVR